MTQPIQLVASVEQGRAAPPATVNPDGSESRFSIPRGSAFVVTDISIQRLSVVSTTDLFNVGLRQNIPTGGTTRRWTFIGTISQNVERSFITGIKFSTDFEVESGSQSAEAVIVRLWGFFKEL